MIQGTTFLQSDEFLILFIVSSITLLVLLIFIICVKLSRRNYRLIGSEFVSSHDLPYEFLNDEESLLRLSEEYEFGSLSPEEQQSFFRAEEFYKVNVPTFEGRGRSITNDIEVVIKERGLQAFEFSQDESILNPKYIVEDKTELNFHNNDLPYSTVTSILNYCLPVRHRLFSDTVYFETKIFEYVDSPNGHFSIGIVTKPYPAFRLPGYNNFSIAYESTGNLKINKPFPTPLQQHLGDKSLFNALVLPPLGQSDIVGFGYHIPTGTVFITKNGRKIMDVMRGLFIDMYPAVGCFSTNGKFQVNLGQRGFVWIEANVKKYGFIPTGDAKRLEGDRGLASLPQYGLADDKLLDKGDELPPSYPEEEIDFFGRSVKDLYNLGSSSKINEKESSSKITNDPEEVMNMRERIYEQNTTTSIDGMLNEESSLISGSASEHQNYQSTTDPLLLQNEELNE
ncbi:protein Ssh4p [[Candida] jaroonii]|uniref:Protein Ssh4p n=1 Tax=[Candida] jaroonii TaxID=467808 RepID=A0ACA9Y7R8_9ASCO|nr:protein Ssh4p [[Candida] jaroonii]